MRPIRVASLVILTFMLAACGTSSQPQNINGPWSAGLNNVDQSQNYSFSATLTEGSGTTVNVTNFAFASSTACFSTQTSEVATFNITGSSNGVLMGSFGMTISTVFPALNNVLTLQGSRNDNGSISGTWTLTGQPGCIGNGTFTMYLPHSDPP